MTAHRPPRSPTDSRWSSLSYLVVLTVPIIAAVVLLIELGALSDDDAASIVADAAVTGAPGVTTLTPSPDDSDGATDADDPAAPSDDGSAPPSGDEDEDEPAESPAEYTVVAGDTLAAIAQRLGVTTAALAAFNSLQDPNALRVGQVLQIPPPDFEPPPPNDAPPLGTTPPDPTPGGTAPEGPPPGGTQPDGPQ